MNHSDETAILDRRRSLRKRVSLVRLIGLAIIASVVILKLCDVGGSITFAMIATIGLFAIVFLGFPAQRELRKMKSDTSL